MDAESNLPVAYNGSLDSQRGRGGRVALFPYKLGHDWGVSG